MSFSVKNSLSLSLSFSLFPYIMCKSLTSVTSDPFSLRLLRVSSFHVESTLFAFLLASVVRFFFSLLSFWQSSFIHFVNQPRHSFYEQKSSWFHQEQTTGRCKWSIRFDEYFPFSLSNCQCICMYTFLQLLAIVHYFLLPLLKFLNVIIKCHLLVTVFLSLSITILSVCPCLFVSLPFHFISLSLFLSSLFLSLSLSAR